MPEEIQMQLPQYEISSLLGRGGMGAVYRGRQMALDRDVAIKILPPDLTDAGRTERFRTEALAMARLNHPGIVKVFDSGQTSDGLLYLVLEYVGGTDVQNFINDHGGRVRPKDAYAITAHVCDALHYAHERGILHRDIKPANILLDADGSVKVADFGLAKLLHQADGGLTQSGAGMGTLAYMAPETMILGAGVDRRADVYAVGVMLYVMLTGKLPRGIFLSPSKLLPDVDPRIDGVVERSLRDDRDLRYSTTAEFRAALDAMLTTPLPRKEAPPSAPVPPRTATPRPAPQPRRAPENSASMGRVKKKFPYALALLSIAVFGALAWLEWSKIQPEPKLVGPVKFIPASLSAQPGVPQTSLQPRTSAGEVIFPLPVVARPSVPCSLRIWKQGLGTSEPLNPNPQDFPEMYPPDGLSDVVAVATGFRGRASDGRHVLALRADGRVVAWGKESRGQCKLPGPINDAVTVAAGGGYSAVLRATGEALAWGFSHNTAIKPPAAGEKIVQIASGTIHLLFLTESGRVFITGDEAKIKTQEWKLPAKAVAIGAHQYHVVVCLEDGSLRQWGNHARPGATPIPIVEGPLLWKKPAGWGIDKRVYERCLIPVTAHVVMAPDGTLIDLAHAADRLIFAEKSGYDFPSLFSAKNVRGIYGSDHRRAAYLAEDGWWAHGGDARFTMRQLHGCIDMAYNDLLGYGLLPVDQKQRFYPEPERLADAKIHLLDFASVGPVAGWVFENKGAKPWPDLDLRGAGEALLSSSGDDLFESVNFNAPRLLRSVQGSFDLETKLTFTSTYTKRFEGAGLLVWKDSQNFLRLERGSTKGQGEPQGILVDVCNDGKYSRRVTYAGFQVKENTLDLMIRRRGEVLKCYWRPPGGAWEMVDVHDIHWKSPLQVGVCAPTAPGTATMTARFDHVFLREEK
jgi:serine/threonine protein kinase/regulation of enolase protein 1 (concanavalin A-like superfamily)